MTAFDNIAQRATKLMTTLVEVESHWDTWSRRIFGTSPKTEGNGKKHNQDEIAYIQMLFSDGLTRPEREKLSYFMEWNYRIKTERNTFLQIYLLWLRAHKKNDWRDILAHASSSAPDETDTTVHKKAGDKKGDGETRTVKRIVPGVSAREAQKALKQGLKMIDNKDHVDGMRDAARFWSGLGLPMMPRTETLDAIEEFLNFIPEKFSDFFGLASDSFAKHAPAAFAGAVVGVERAADHVTTYINNQPARRSRRTGLSRLLK